MLTTEDEAKEKLCRAGGSLVVPMIEASRRENMDGVDERIAARAKSLPEPTCRASDCMFWRWHYDRVTCMEMQRVDYEQQGFVAVGSRGSTLGPMITMHRETSFGYCGLAGPATA